jgi:pyruvate/2-oxoglutarate dehydrogenase complex dihydrolipoamide acyltransferase (E2) component
MALHVTPIEPPDQSRERRERIVELAGNPLAARAPATIDDTPVVLALQLQAIDNFVEMIRLRTAIAEKDRRIATLTVGLRTWRERAVKEEVARRHEIADAHEREREIISLLHQQMRVADEATEELERIHALPWWRRLLG